MIRIPLTEDGYPVTSKAWTLEEKVISFWDKVDRSAGPDACWTWTGAVTSKWGYGCFGIASGVTRGAHKLAWLFTHGDTKGLCVLHKCDNRVCVNPAHLFLGTKQDNSDDKVAKGRQVRGVGNIHAKLTEEAVKEIISRKPAKSHVHGVAKGLSEKYGVGKGAIHAIWRGDHWKHLQEGK